MNRYRITKADEIYAAEFRRNLDTGDSYHSPGLQRVLNVMRGGPKAGKYVLITREPFKRWVLTRLPEARGEAIEILRRYQFTDLKDAEWAVFKLRWRDQTGRALDL